MIEVMTEVTLQLQDGPQQAASQKLGHAVTNYPSKQTHCFFSPLFSNPRSSQYEEVILETSNTDHKKYINESINSIVINLPHYITIMSGENEENWTNKYLLSVFSPTLCPLMYLCSIS